MTTSVAAFPNGFAHPKAVYRSVREAVHVYRDGQKFALLFEVRKPDGLREYRLAEADKLLGPWANVLDWTVTVSHGELLRSGMDEHLEADLQHPVFWSKNSRQTGGGKIMPSCVGISFFCEEKRNLPKQFGCCDHQAPLTLFEADVA